MSINPNLLADQHRPDDRAQQSPTGDSPTDGATNTDASGETSQLLEEIIHCAHSGNQVRKFALMTWLLRSELPLSDSAWRTITSAFRQGLSAYPKPVVSDVAIEHVFILDEIIGLAAQHETSGILVTATTLRYRICEACGEYEHARALIGKLRDRAEKAESRLETAQMINNYGYEFLLEGNYREAEPYFVEALELFQRLDNKLEIANAQANLLTCQFALLPSHDWGALLPALRKAQHVLYMGNDWRVRKTMRLFAARAEARQRHTVAKAWARRAANASSNLPTQLHLDDITYLNSLRGKRLQDDLFGHRVNTRQADDDRAYLS